MKKERIISLLLSFLLLMQMLVTGVCAQNETADVPPEEVKKGPTLDCKSALLLELNTDGILYEKNADEKVYPASLTKVMTCLLALEHGNLEDMVTVDGSLLEGMDADASIVGLVNGETMSLENLLYCIMVPSANDACLVVADYIAGSVEDFVKMMNEKAAALGCKGTHFVNPDGLHDDNHYTTARDMSIITKAALKNDMFRKLCGTGEYTLPETNASSSREVYSTNYFISRFINDSYYWDAISGVKTGFTTPAGRCLISLLVQDDFSYLCIVMGAETPYDADGKPVYGHFTESRKLLEYGLENFALLPVLSRLNPVAQVPVTGGEVSSVVVAPAQDVRAMLPTDFEQKDVSVSYTLSSGDSLQAPVAADDVVGTVYVSYDGKSVGKTELRAISAVKKAGILTAPTQEEDGNLLVIGAIVLGVVLLLVVIFSGRGKKRRKRRR